MMKGKKRERGQILILVALSIITLIGFTALAIDGGQIYLDRRRAQNAADQAAFAAAFEKIQGGDWYVAGLARAEDNGFNNDGVTNTVTINNPPISGAYSGDDKFIQVMINTTPDTAFLQLFYTGPIAISAGAVTRAEGSFFSSSPLVSNAVVTLGNCLSGDGHNLSFTGGGGSGGIVAKNGGVFLNSPESTVNDCAMAPPNNGYGIVSEGPITSVGSHDYSGESMIHPVPINTGFNGGIPITDPLASLSEPTCTGPGFKDGDTYYPGNFLTIGPGFLQPGIYCVTGDISLAGPNFLQGDGVLIYTQGGIKFTGNAWMNLTAPTEENCLGTKEDTTASCTYKGIVIFSARGNTSTIETRGNGDQNLKGLVYVLDGTVQSRGGGASPDEIDVDGQVVAKNLIGDGNGSFTVRYNEDWIYPPQIDPPILELTE
jgi:hypothetical protein